ncbi:hypothetical protein T02_2975 [Trichinella nativa]|uniref:Uncharacterized protein n=1 Tax=Trichinella nativa TaxID=6335 RepID=A0A0V1L4B8_9BILA|nr:hypothetical protein T02_2975 [Trichinella nativa]
MTVVTRMVSPWSAKAHNIMTDNFFRSVGLTNWNNRAPTSGRIIDGPWHYEFSICSML